MSEDVNYGTETGLVNGDRVRVIGCAMGWHDDSVGTLVAFEAPSDGGPGWWRVLMDDNEYCNPESVRRVGDRRMVT